MAGTKDERDYVPDITTTQTHRVPNISQLFGSRQERVVQTGGQPERPRAAPMQTVERVPTMPEREQPKPEGKAVAWRPERVLPVLSVTALRADGAPGQNFFVRGDSAVCGRDPCDIQIANDPSLSKRHFELVRLEVEGEHLWEIRDLESSGGIWIRVDRAWLYKSAEICVGNTRFRFVSETEAAADSQPVNREATQVFDASMLHGGSILRRLPRGGVPGADFVLKKGAPHWLGSDPQATIKCEDDEFVDRRHAIVEFVAGSRRWQVEDKDSTNGLWIRRTTHRVSFENRELIVRAGEQVFVLRMDSHA